MIQERHFLQCRDQSGNRADYHPGVCEVEQPNNLMCFCVKQKLRQVHVLYYFYNTGGHFPPAVQHIYFGGGPGDSRTTWHGEPCWRR